MPLANVLERCPFPLVTTGRAMVADWPVTSLAPQIERPRLGRHRQIALKLLMDPRLNSRCPPRLRPLPSLALNVLLLGDTYRHGFLDSHHKDLVQEDRRRCQWRRHANPGLPRGHRGQRSRLFLDLYRGASPDETPGHYQGAPRGMLPLDTLLPGKPSSNNVSPRSPSSAVPNP